MSAELLVSLVEAVDRQEECLRIADVNRHGQTKTAAGLPHRIEPRIVDPHERALRTAVA